MGCLGSELEAITKMNLIFWIQCFLWQFRWFITFLFIQFICIWADIHRTLYFRTVLGNMLKFMKPFVKYQENKITNKSPEKAAQVVIKDRERNGSVTDTVFKDLKTPIQNSTFGSNRSKSCGVKDIIYLESAENKFLKNCLKTNCLWVKRFLQLKWITVYESRYPQ